MALDAYDPCPCGSGKKLKFCCSALVDEMEQVSKLQQAGQIEACSRKLADLHQKHPDNLWVVTSRASMLLGNHEAPQAKEELRHLLQNNPDHIQGLMLYAIAAFNTDGFEKSRSAIYRCFQKCLSHVPGMVGYLVVGIAMEMAARQKFMAARQHLVFAMRLVEEDRQRDVFIRLHELDSNIEIPYPLRSVHHLAEIELEGDDQTAAEKARKLADIGCWGAAARKYQSLVQHHSEHAGLFQNLGLCLAWDGDQVAAGQALHQAAQLGDDAMSAVESETIAQLLDLQETDDRVGVTSTKLELTSVSQALSKIGDNPRFIKVPLNDEDRKSEGAPSELFQILDRSSEGLQLTADSHLNEVPRIVGHVSFYDKLEAHNLPARGFVTGFPSTELNDSIGVLRELLGDVLIKEELDTDSDFEESVAAEEFALFWRWHNPAETPVVIRRRLEQRQWEYLVDEVWPNLVQHGLGRKSPKEAAADGDRPIALMAAAYVFDAYCSRNEYILDFAGLCETLGLEPPAKIAVTAETPIAHFTALQLKRIDVKTLADDQLVYVTNRAMLLHHGAFLYAVLEELLTRPECGKRVDLSQVYLALIDLSVQKYDRHTAFEWIGKALEWAKSQDNHFELGLQWKMRELTLRVEDPHDPELTPLFKELWDKYGKKLPELRQHLTMLAMAYKLPVLKDSSIITPDQMQAESSGGILLGDAPQEPEGEGKKLWLPGQE